MDDQPAQDDAALALRKDGMSYAEIARTLGFGRSGEAVDAVGRALRRLPMDERADLRREESSRLDVLAEAIRTRGDLDAHEIARYLETVEVLRERVLAE